jgi:hypothetical protein
MKGAATPALRAWRSLSLLLLLVSAATPLVFREANTFVWRAVGWLHEGFLAAYVDAGSVVSGCF